MDEVATVIGYVVILLIVGLPITIFVQKIMGIK